MADGLLLTFYIVNAVLFGGLWLYFFVLLLKDLFASNSKRLRTIVLVHNLALCFLNLVFSISVCFDMGFFIRADGFKVNAVRWLVYTASCSLLAASIAETLAHRRVWYWVAVVLVGATIFTGYLTSHEPSVRGRLLLYISGFVPFILALLVVVLFKRIIPNVAYAILLIILLVSWAVYPIAFALGHAMYRHISFETESIIYAIADWFSKIIFSLYITHTIDSYYARTSDKKRDDRERQQLLEEEEDY